jgi:hypothetical protein
MGVCGIDLKDQGPMLGEQWASASGVVAMALLVRWAGTPGLQNRMVPLKQGDRYHELVSRSPQQSQWSGLQLQGAAWSDEEPKSWRDGFRGPSGADGEPIPKMQSVPKRIGAIGCYP